LVARTEYDLGRRAFLLAFTNVVAIQFASSVVLFATRDHRAISASGEASAWLKRNAMTIAVIIGLGAVLSVNLRDVVSERLFETRVQGILVGQIATKHTLAKVDTVTFDGDTVAGAVVVRAVVRSVDNIEPAEVSEIEQWLPTAPGGRPVEPRIRQVTIEVVTDEGMLTETGGFLIGD
jgi:hypothetical protein